MEELDLEDLFKYFFKRVPIILIIGMLFWGVGISYTYFLKTPLYKSDTKILLVNRQDNLNNTTDIQNDIMLNQKLVSTYSELVKSKKVLNQVINILELKINYEDLLTRISVNRVKDSEIINISVVDENSNTASRIANTVANVFEKEVKNIYKLENVSIIDEAEKAKNPYNINFIKTALISSFAGMMLTFIIMFIIYYFDTSVKSSEEIENRLGIPVIGTVPRS